MLLVAACPASSLVNLYTNLARSNVALSVTLTAVSCVAAVFAMPILMVGCPAYLGEGASFAVPVPAIIGSLVLTLVVPILTGMTIRRVIPNRLDGSFLGGRGSGRAGGCGSAGASPSPERSGRFRRNVAIATALAVTVLGDLEFAVFATAYFLSQVPLLLAAVIAFRWVQSADRIAKNGTDLR